MTALREHASALDVVLVALPLAARLDAVGAHSAAVSDIAVSPGGRRIASSGFDGTVRLFDVAASNLVPGVVVRREGVPSVEFEPAVPG